MFTGYCECSKGSLSLKFDIRHSLRKVGVAFLSRREASSQECVYRRIPELQFPKKTVSVLEKTCFAKKKPTTNEKKMLHQAGLGCKKIDLLADDTVEAVLKKVNNVMLKMYAGIQQASLNCVHVLG